MPTPPDPARDAKVRDLHAKGLPDAVIATRIGCSLSSVPKMRRRLGLSANMERA